LKAGVQGTIGHQAGDVIAGNAVNVGERPANNHAAIRLADTACTAPPLAPELPLRKPALSSEPSAFNRAMRLSGTAVDEGEVAARENLPVGLQRQRQHVAVHARRKELSCEPGGQVVGNGIQNIDLGIAGRTQRRVGWDSTRSH
jgi:hypothetical protein